MIKLQVVIDMMSLDDESPPCVIALLLLPQNDSDAPVEIDLQAKISMVFAKYFTQARLKFGEDV